MKIVQRIDFTMSCSFRRKLLIWLFLFAFAEEKCLAEERFARWIGAWDSGDPNSADNERIDADLAREYGAGLDE